jgi:hypothetical protein
MQHSTFRLSRSFQAVVYVSFGLLLVTGAGWMITQARLDQPAWREMAPMLMKIHGAAAMSALLVLGALIPHIRHGWTASKNRLSGTCIIALNAFLIFSGYGLYYAGDDELRAWLSRWHGWIGLGIIVILPAHIIAGRAIIRRSYRQKMRRELRGKIVRQSHESLL